MNYDTYFWNKYTEKNDSMYNEEFAKFIRDLAISLRSISVLEVGCNNGNDLRKFPEDFNVHGIDLNDFALKKAKKNLPTFHFKKGSITEIPYEDSSFDFVFTHNVLNYIQDRDMEKALNELFRVSKRYIATCEFFKENEEKMKDQGVDKWHRNIFNRWMNCKVKIISNVDMHEEIEPNKVRFTLVRKV